MHADNTVAEIAHCEDRLLDAIRKSDIDHLDFLIHDDLIFIGPDGIPVNKIIDLEKYRADALHLSKLSSAHQQIKIIGDNAVVTVQIQMSGTLDGHEFAGLFQYCRVWKSFGDSWKVIAGSCTRIP